MGDAPLELRKPGGMLVYGLPAASTLFMLRMLWATKRDAVPSDHSYIGPCTHQSCSCRWRRPSLPVASRWPGGTRDPNG